MCPLPLRSHITQSSTKEPQGFTPVSYNSSGGQKGGLAAALWPFDKWHPATARASALPLVDKVLEFNVSSCKYDDKATPLRQTRPHGGTRKALLSLTLRNDWLSLLELYRCV